MSRCKTVLGLAALLSVLLAVFPTTIHAQAESGLITDIRIRTGAGFEYMARTISWDDNEDNSTMNAMLFTLRPSLEINRRISLGGIAGYALSNFDTLLFRELPLSLELDQGNIGGWILGGELEAALFEIRDFEIGIRGEYVYYMGKEDTLEIPLPSVDGEAATTPSWSRIHAGVQVTYIPFSSFYPYLRLAYDHVDGTFEVQQSVLDLTGTQTRDFTSKGKFNAVVGLFFEPLDRMEFRGEVQIIPSGGNVDIAVAAGLTYVF